MVEGRADEMFALDMKKSTESKNKEGFLKSSKPPVMS
jgi:hypothetical protein